MESLFEGIWCIKHGRIGAEKPLKEKKHFILWKHNISFEDPKVEAHR